jgi:hypothetical protein
MQGVHACGLQEHFLSLTWQASMFGCGAVLVVR